MDRGANGQGSMYDTGYEFIGWEPLIEEWLPRLLGAALILVASCSDATGPRGSMQVRVHNQDATALTIQVGDTDFGSVAAGATSIYREIDEGDLPIVIDGASFGTEFFCDGCKDFASTSRWSLYFTATGVTGISLEY